MKRKNIVFISILIIGIITGIIISLTSRKITEKISKENKVEYSNIEIENKDLELSKKKKVLEDYLSIYALRDCIQIHLYEKLNLCDGYDDYNEYYEKEFVAYKTEEIINGQMYYCYGTSIKYKDFKNAMLNYISEELFEKQFTIYQKNNNGMLDIYVNARDGSNYEVVKMTEISDNTYEVEYKFYMGENEGLPGKMTVIFEKNNDRYIIKECLTKPLENVMYLEVFIEDEESGQAMYRKPVKIENMNIIKELETIINSGTEHDFNGAFGLDMPPYANFYLGNGDKVTVSAVDDLEMQGEERGNYIIVTINDDEANKRTYKVEEEIGLYFSKIYDKNY